ncbi:MAG TPA: cupin domain-containing protein [Burkholderiaceae bacterium]|nr:cupin domain-containing protein [Burkholderiaceae bacterium]
MGSRRFAEFEADARARGFDEIVERRWAPGTVLESHAHPFAVEALVIEGEMWLVSSDGERHLSPGESFSVPRDAPHGERYGAAGTTVWVARRHTRS